MKSPWIDLKSEKPTTNGRIIVWYDKGAHEAFVDGPIVDCPSLELAWDVCIDEPRDLFEAWFYLDTPEEGK